MLTTREWGETVKATVHMTSDTVGVWEKVLAFRELALTVFIALLISVIGLRSPHFLNLSNFKIILLDASILMVVAIAQMMVMLTAGIDLSVTSTLAFSGMAVALMVRDGIIIEPWLCLVVGTLIGLILGSINGLLVAKGGMPPIIATIATMTIYRGATYLISGGAWVSAHQMTDGFISIARGRIFGIPNLVMTVVLVSLIFHYFLGHTPTGRKIYAVGDNPNAARFAGINVNRIRFLVYLLSGTLCGLSGVLWVSRYASAQCNAAVGFEMLAVASCIIGGVFISGGSGSVTGVLLGSFLLAIIVNALAVMRVNPFWRMAIQGVIILVAVVVDTTMSRRIGKRGAISGHN